MQAGDTLPQDSASPSAGSRDPPPTNGGAYATFGTGPAGSQRFNANDPRSARLQRDFAVLRQEIEGKNQSIRREIRSVVTQLDKLRYEGDDPEKADVQLALGPMAPKDPQTRLVRELQDKIEEQQQQIQDAREALRTATLELEDVKASQSAELVELRSLRDQFADRDAKALDNASQRVDELRSTVEEQSAQFAGVHSQLNAREEELQRVKDELANTVASTKLEDDSTKKELRRLGDTIEDQSKEIFGLKAQLVASDGLKAQLLARNAELQDKASDTSKAIEDTSGLQKQLEEQRREIASLKDQLFEKELEVKKLQDMPPRRLEPEQQGPSPQLLMDLQGTVEAQRHELTTLKMQLSESEARAAACSLELSQNDQAKVEELQGRLEDMRVALATTKAQLVTRNLELTKMEAQLVARNLELTKYEEQRAELASVKAQLMARDLKLMKQEVAMALTDAKSPTAAGSSPEATNDKESILLARISELETEATSRTEKVKQLEEELRRREDELLRSPQRHLEESNGPLAEQLSQLAADVLTRNEQLAEKQLKRARSFLEVLRGAAWAREATPSSFKLGKFLDDLAIFLELEAKEALSANGRIAKARKGRLSPAALPAPTQNPGAPALPSLNAADAQDDTNLPTPLSRSSFAAKVQSLPPTATCPNPVPSFSSSNTRSPTSFGSMSLRSPPPTAGSGVHSYHSLSTATGASSSLRSSEASDGTTIYSSPNFEEPPVRAS